MLLDLQLHHSHLPPSAHEHAELCGPPSPVLQVSWWSRKLPSMPVLTVLRALSMLCPLSTPRQARQKPVSSKLLELFLQWVIVSVFSFQEEVRSWEFSLYVSCSMWPGRGTMVSKCRNFSHQFQYGWFCAHLECRGLLTVLRFSKEIWSMRCY